MIYMNDFWFKCTLVHVDPWVKDAIVGLTNLTLNLTRTLPLKINGLMGSAKLH